MSHEARNLKTICLDIANTLDPESLFTPFGIIQAGEQAGQIDHQAGPQDQDQLIQKLRVYLSRVAKEFPKDGDGTYQMASGIIVPAWYGWRWLEELLTQWGQQFRVPDKDLLEKYGMMIAQLDKESCYTVVQAGNALALGRFGLEVTPEQMKEAFRVALFLQLKYFPAKPDELYNGERAWNGLRWTRAHTSYIAEFG